METIYCTGWYAAVTRGCVNDIPVRCRARGMRCVRHGHHDDLRSQFEKPGVASCTKLIRYRSQTA